MTYDVPARLQGFVVYSKGFVREFEVVQGGTCAAVCLDGGVQHAQHGRGRQHLGRRDLAARLHSTPQGPGGHVGAQK